MSTDPQPFCVTAICDHCEQKTRKKKDKLEGGMLTVRSSNTQTNNKKQPLFISCMVLRIGDTTIDGWMDYV